MIRNLLSSEAHRDPYVWAAVLMAHFAIGSMLWPVAGVWAVAVYAAFEGLQAAMSRRLWWDSVLDWCGVALGCAFVAYDSSLLAAASALTIAATGYATRDRT